MHVANFLAIWPIAATFGHQVTLSQEQTLTIQNEARLNDNVSSLQGRVAALINMTQLSPEQAARLFAGEAVAARRLSWAAKELLRKDLPPRTDGSTPALTTTEAIDYWKRWWIAHWHVRTSTNI